jgi:hypothetical protein
VLTRPQSALITQRLIHADVVNNFMKMKIHSYILLGLGILSGCSGNSEKAHKANNITNVAHLSYILDSLDYEIINEAIFQSATISPSLSHRYNKNSHFTLSEIKANVKNMVIVDSTYCMEDAGENAIQRHIEIDASDSLWIENLAIRNHSNSRICFMPSNYFDFKIFPDSKFDSIFYNSNLGWDAFWKIYEYKSVIIRVSIPAYNKEKDRAVIYLEHDFKGDNGKGNVIWLKRDNKKWIAYDIVILWVS